MYKTYLAVLYELMLVFGTHHVKQWQLLQDNNVVKWNLAIEHS